MQDLIEIVPGGGTILDPFMGSATTGVAALSKGYNFIGCEMDKHYFEVSKSRLDTYQ